MDAGNSVHSQYSVKQLLAERGPEGVRHVCTPFSGGILCINEYPSKELVTGPGGIWEALLKDRANILVWQHCQGGSPWEHSSHSLEPLSFLRSVRTEAQNIRTSVCIPYPRE